MALDCDGVGWTRRRCCRADGGRTEKCDDGVHLQTQTMNDDYYFPCAGFADANADCSDDDGDCCDDDYC